MVRVNDNQVVQQEAPAPTRASRVTKPNDPSRDGRPPVAGTKLAKIMRERHIRVHQIGTVFRVSDRTVYNYLTRKVRIPALQLGALCDRLDMDPDELVDDRGFLLQDDAEEHP